MHVTKRITMDLNNPRKRTVDLSQTDNVREVLLTVLADGLPYDMTEGGDVTLTAMTVAYIKANGVGGEYATTHENPAVELVENTTNRYKVRLDEHATDVPGHTEVFVKFKSGSLVLHSFPITLNVGKTLPENTDPNQPYFDVFVRKDSMAAATEDDTGEVHYDAENDKLVYTPGSGGGGSVTPASIVTATGQMTATQKTNTRTNIGAAPSTNIAKTALASEVQTSLEHADKSVRFDMTQGLTDAQKSTARSNIGAGTGSYSKPSGGIPSTDMAQAVQTALTAAGTAVQPAALNGYVPTSVFAAVTPSADLVEVKRDASTGKLYVLVNGSTPAPSGDSNTTLITMTESGSELIASKTSSEIYTLLSGGAVNLVLIDYAGRQGTLAKKPISSGGGYTDAKFWAFDAENENVIEYAINSSGVVTYGTLALTGYYTKPSGGIPASDLASGVQTSLGKADGAVRFDTTQSLTTAQKTQARTNIGAGTYSLPLTGIPTSDIATEKVAISADTDHAGQFVTSKSFSQISAAISGGSAIEAVFQPDSDTEITCTGMDIRSASAVFTFVDSSATMPTIYVFTVTDSEYPTATFTKFVAVDANNLATKTSGMTQSVGYRASDGTLWTSPGSGGGGVSIYSVDIVYETGYWYIRHDGLDIAAENIFTALFGGDLVQVIDDAGAECELMAISYSPGEGRLVYKSSNVDNGVPEWRVFTIQDEIVQGAPRAEVTMTPVDLLPLSDSRTASAVGSGFTVDGNTVYTVSGTISRFKLTTSPLPAMFAGQCIEIRLTVGSTAITTPTWPSWAKHMNGWDGNFDANTYYDIVIDDAGNVYHSTREVTA